MKIGKNASAVMRQIFGFNDSMVSAQPQPMLFRVHSREGKFIRELAKHGLVEIEWRTIDGKSGVYAMARQAGTEPVKGVV